MMNMNEEKLNRELDVNESLLEQVVGGAGVTKGMCKIINCDYVRVHDSPGGGNILGQIKCGKEVPYLGKTKGWGHIIFNGQDAYIYKDFFTT